MAGHERETHPDVGWGRSDKQSVTIGAGNTGANLGTLNLGRNYAYIIIRCSLCTGIAASTTLGITVAFDESEALCSVYELSGGSLTILAPTLPTTGSLHFMVIPALGAQFVHLTLSKNATGSVTFDVYGVAESIQG